MPPRRHCQCLHPDSLGCTAAAIQGSDLSPLLLETDGDRDVLPLAAGRSRKPEYQGYTLVEVAVDSGAAASAIPERCLPDHPVRPSEGPRNGVHYLAANGGRIPNQGEMVFEFLTKERHRGHIAFQVADVKRPLLAVSTLTKAGYDVTFGPGGGQVVNRGSGKRMSFAKCDGIYVLELLIAPARLPQSVPDGQGGTDFPRQGPAAGCSNP